MSGVEDDGEDPAFPLWEEADGHEPPAPFERRICWRKNDDDDDTAEIPVVLWSGEVLLNNGRGVAGPFGVDRARAEAWAIATARAMPADQVFGAQLVEYLCAESHVAALIAEGEREYRRLNRYCASPVQSGSVILIDLPQRPR